MDYTDRLRELVSAEEEKNNVEEHRKKFFEGHQRAAFEKIVQPLNEILDAAAPIISRRQLGSSFANIKISGPGSQTTTYDVEPNSIGKYSSSPSPAPGYCVKTETTYNNGLVYIEPTQREYVINDAETLLEDLMKHIAKAMAKSNRELLSSNREDDHDQ